MALETAEPAGQTPQQNGRLRTTFRALRYVNYRYIWLGQVGHAASLWMEQVIRPLLVLELTGSALHVGSIITARMIPQLVFGLFSGAVADRYDKQTILKLSQAVTLLMHLSLGILLLTGHIQLSYIYVTAVVSGAANAFTQPARQALIPRVVPRHDLLNAVALNTAAMNLMRVAGAGIAGLMVLVFDYAQVYLVNAVIYASVIWTTFQIRLPKSEVSPTDIADYQPRRWRSQPASLGKDLWAGFKYVKRTHTVLFLILSALILFVFGQPYQQVFIPLLAQDVLHTSRSAVGLMLAVTGLGALTGSLALASLRTLAHRGALMLTGLVVFGLALIGLAHSTSLWMAFPFLFIAGSLSVTYMSLNNALLIESTPDEYLGRVFSFMSLDRGLMSGGAMMAGALGEYMGAPMGLTIMAGACSVLALLALVFFPRIRNLS